MCATEPPCARRRCLAIAGKRPSRMNENCAGGVTTAHRARIFAHRRGWHDLGDASWPSSDSLWLRNRLRQPALALRIRPRRSMSLDQSAKRAAQRDRLPRGPDAGSPPSPGRRGRSSGGGGVWIGTDDKIHRGFSAIRQRRARSPVAGSRAVDPRRTAEAVVAASASDAAMPPARDLCHSTLSKSCP